MKKKYIFTFLFLLSLIFNNVKTCADDDGSLKIDTNLNSQEKNKEIHYIEQENDLSKLFLLETTELIYKEKDKIKNNEKINNTLLFLNPKKNEKVSKFYQSLLFNSKTINLKNDYQFLQYEKKSYISWNTITIIVLGLSVMIYSIFRTINLRKGRNE